MKNINTFEQFVNENKKQQITIGDIKYVMDFFRKHFPSKVDFIKNIPIYIVTEEEWPDKSRQTENDRKGGIRIHEKHLNVDEKYGWLIHEVGHVLDLKGERKEYLVDKKKFSYYPNEDDEQTPMYYQFFYYLENGMSENEVLKLEKDSYLDVKGGRTTWSPYKEKFFREYYRKFKELIE